VAIEKPPDRAGRERRAVFAAQHVGQFDQRYVHLRLDRAEDDRASI
jgi:hypothetical protein